MKWTLWDSAFAWGFLTDYPDQLTMIQLLLANEAGLPERDVAILGRDQLLPAGSANTLHSIAFQFGSYLDMIRLHNKSEQRRLRPNQHGTLILEVCGPLFRNAPREVFHVWNLGCYCGESIGYKGRIGDSVDQIECHEIQGRINFTRDDIKPAFASIEQFLRIAEEELQGSDLEMADVSVVLQRLLRSRFAGPLMLLNRVTNELRNLNEGDVSDETDLRPRLTFGAISLLEMDAEPNARLNEQDVTLTSAQYNVVQALIEAARENRSLSAKELSEKSGHNGRSAVDRLIGSNPVWGQIIKTPGQRGGRYRLVSSDSEPSEVQDS